MKLNRDQVQLIMVDIQQKLVPLMSNKEDLVANFRKIIGGAQCLKIPIIYTEQYPQGLGYTIDELRQLIKPGEPVEKTEFSCCQAEIFRKVIAGNDRPQLLLGGIEAHICVYQTALDLIDLGYQVHLLTDCIASRVPANVRLAIRKLAACGVQLTGVEMALFELPGSSQAAEFKTISKLIK